jgi:hypothetical protein
MRKLLLITASTACLIAPANAEPCSIKMIGPVATSSCPGVSNGPVSVPPPVEMWRSGPAAPPMERVHRNDAPAPEGRGYDSWRAPDEYFLPDPPLPDANTVGTPLEHQQ